MTIMNKYNYYWVLQGNYGYGWDDLCHYDKVNPNAYREAKADRESYKENQKGVSFRIVDRRVLNESVSLDVSLDTKE